MLEKILLLRKNKKIRILGLIALVLFVFYLFVVHYTDLHQVGIVRNMVTGELSLDTKAGFSFTAPWVQVARVDTRPKKLCIRSSAKAVHCKLVEFAPEHYVEFVERQGFRYYWWKNRISFNFGHEEEYRGMSDILYGYAFSGKDFPFIKVSQVQLE